MKKLSLSHTPIPFSDEFLASFLLRASYINGYQTPKQMLNSAGIPIYQQSYESIFTNEDKFKQVIERLELSDDLLDLVIKKVPPTFQNFFWIGNHVIQPQLLEISLNKFCSSCLEEKGYWKKNWLLIPLTICLDHHIDLIAKCPECCNPLQTNRRSLFKCSNCNFDLRKSQKQRSTLEDIKINKWFLDNFTSPDENFNEKFFYIWIDLSEYFSNLEILKSHSYILKLCHEYFDSENKFISTFINEIKNNLDYAHPRIQLLPFLRNKSRFKFIIDNIQSHFLNYKIFSSKCIKRKFNKNETIHILGVSFIVFHKRLKAGILYHNQLIENYRNNFPAHILEEWIINEKKNINGNYACTCPPSIKDESEFYFDAEEISKIFDINRDTTRKFLRIPMIPATKKFINHHTKTCLDKEFVIDFNSKYIFLGSLAKLLNVTPITLKDKISSLNIKPIIKDDFYPTYYSRNDVKNLSKSIIENITVFKNNFGRKKTGSTINQQIKNYINLNEAAKLLGISSLQTAQLIQHKWLQVEDIEVRPYRIPRRSIDEFIQQKNDPTFIDIDEVLKTLNCTFNQLQKNWIMTGFLTLKHIGYWRSFPRWQVDHVIEIHKEFFTASEANNFLGMHRTHITNLTARGLIKPYLYDNHNYSIRLFKRKDVKKLLQAGYGNPSNEKRS